MGKRLFIFIFCFFALSLNSWANPAVKQAAERSIRQVLKLSGCADWLVEESSPKIGSRVAYLMEGMSETQMARELEWRLIPKNLASLVRYTDDIPQKQILTPPL